MWWYAAAMLFKSKLLLWGFGKLLFYTKIIKAKCWHLAVEFLPPVFRNMVEQSSNLMFLIYLFLLNLQEFPDSLKKQIYLKEWHVYNTSIQTIPAYIALFQDLRVLELSKNRINHLPVEIGKLAQDIQQVILMPFNYIAGKRVYGDILSHSLIIVFSLVSSEQSPRNFYSSLAVIILLKL